MKRLSRAIAVSVLLGSPYAVVAGCSSAPIQPAYTQPDLQVVCERQGGWWRPDRLRDGFCEYQAPGSQVR